MNKLSIISLKVLRKIYAKTIGVKILEKPPCDQDPDSVSQKIYEALMSDKPCMIARFGSTELSCLCNYIGTKVYDPKITDYIKGNIMPWWWEPKIMNQMQQWSGFFPPTETKLEQFCEFMLQDIPQVDILGSWLPLELDFDHLLVGIPKVRLGLLDPYWVIDPWTRALDGKKVLVVHPFAETIEQQYKKRDLLFENNLLPKFELITIKAVQSIAGEKTEFIDWFEALEFMKSEIDKVDYDICLIGAGAYGFPLAAHIKRMGKKGFHIGGSLQLLFGISGKRWENKSYHQDYNYASLMNEYWVKANKTEIPKRATLVEGGCYW